MSPVGRLIAMLRFRLSKFTLACLILAGSSFPLLADPPKVENAKIVEEVEGAGDADPFSGGPGYGDELGKLSAANAGAHTATMLLRYETYEVPTITAIILMDAQKEDSVRRADLIELVRKGEAKVAECQATRFEAGTTSTLESIIEQIYPTEYEPPEGIPTNSPLARPDEQLSPMDRQLKVAMRHACPTAFDTKNTGVTLEAEVRAVEIVEKQWDVSLVFTQVKYLKEKTWVEGTIMMPVFGVAKARHVLRTEDDRWNLLSSQAKVTDEGVADPATTHLSFLKVARVR